MKRFGILLAIFSAAAGYGGLLAVVVDHDLPFERAPEVRVEVNTLEDQVVAPYWEVRYQLPNAYGSGVVLQVGDELLVLTAAHVTYAEDGQGAEFPLTKMYLRKEFLGREEVREADVVFRGNQDTGPDLALLRPRDSKGLKPCKPLLDSPLVLGEDAWYIGTGSGVHARLEKTIISRFEWFDLDRGLVMANGNGWYGNSGGPMFVKRGGEYRLTGIVVLLAAARDPKSPILAEGPDTIARFLKAFLEK